MRVKCVICDQIGNIESESLLAKQLRNRPIHTYMCNACHERIAKKTYAHLASESFHLYKPKKSDSDW